VLLRERHRIRAILETDRRWSVYALGDLQPGYFDQCDWHSPPCEGALALVYRGADTPVLFTLGDARALAPVLDELAAEERLYLSVRPDVLPLIRERWEVRQETAMWRMVLSRERAPLSQAGRTVRLGRADLAAVQRLYADGQRSQGNTSTPQHEESPDFFFPYMLEHGVFAGVYEEGALVSAAGTHLVAPWEGVAAIGNVYTRRDRRGRGFAAEAVAAVVTDLQRMGIGTIALNVRQDNAPAIRIYERLGFRRYCPFYEGLAVRP